MTTSADGVTVTTTVAVAPDVAFRVFTEEIDAWWRRDPRFRWLSEGRGEMAFEGGADGQLVERDAGGDVFVVGRVLAWEPGARLAFAFRGRDFAPGEVTEVEVRFDPAPNGTRVVLRHRGWDTIAKGHPSRRGLYGGAFVSLLGVWWADLLDAQRAWVARSARGL